MVDHLSDSYPTDVLKLVHAVAVSLTYNCEDAPIATPFDHDLFELRVVTPRAVF